MARDNTLGAPTEGLGQNVTFTAGGSVARSQAQGLRRGQVRNEMVGGRASNSSGPIQIPEQDQTGMQTLKVFQRLSGEILGPKIEQARQDAFLSGMQRAATGEAVSELVAEQPWYASVFGDTPVVEGARAFTSFSKAQSEASEVEGNMDELRKLSPVEFQKAMGKRMSALNTGDATTDSMVMQSMMKEMPGLMKAHSKEHIGWQQGNYAQAARNGQLTASNRLRSVMAKYNPSAKPESLLNGGEVGAFTDSTDVLEAQAAFVQAFQQPSGVPLETHQKLTTAVISDMLVQKNLHGFYTLLDAEVVRDLGPENSKRLLELADRQESRARAEMPLQLVGALAAIKAMPSLYDTKGINETLSTRINELNAAYKATTGAREDLISGNSAAELRASLLTAQVGAERRAIEASRKANDKTLDAAEKAAAAQQATHETTGILLSGNSTENLTAAVRREAWDSMRGDVKRLHSARAAQFLRQGGKDADIDQQGRGDISLLASKALAGDLLDSVEQLYVNEYAPMVAAGGEGLAMHYFGDHAPVFATYHSIRKSLPKDVNGQIDANGIAAAYAIAKTPRTPLATGKDTVDQEVKAYVADKTTNYIMADTLKPRFQDDVTRRLLPYVNRGNPTTDVKERSAAALKNAQVEGLEIAGGYWWDSKGGARFTQAVNKAGNQAGKVTPEEYDEAIGNSIERIIELQGLAPGTATVIYSEPQTAGGNPTLTVLGDIDTTDGESWRAYTLTAGDVVAQFNAAKASNKSREGDKRRGGMRGASSAQPFVPN